MSFTAALLVVLGLVALALGLACYHLLGRLEVLERAVAGGFVAPDRRLTREEFEQRFRVALARSQLARTVESGIVIALGSEPSEVATAICTLDRGDGVFVIGEGPWRTQLPPGIELLDDDNDLGFTARPYAVIIDGGRVRTGRAVVNGRQLLDLLADHT